MVFLEVESLQSLMMEAIKFRNQVVATEYWIGNNDFAKNYSALYSQYFTANSWKRKFFPTVDLPRLTETLAPLHKLSPLETAYFSRMMRFVVKEQIISKVGYQEGTGSSNADLWNMPLAGRLNRAIFTRA